MIAPNYFNIIYAILYMSMCCMPGCDTKVDSNYAAKESVVIDTPFKNGIPIEYIYCNEDSGDQKEYKFCTCIKRIILKPGEPRYNAVMSVILGLNPVQIFDGEAKAIIRNNYKIPGEGFPETITPVMSLIIQHAGDFDVRMALVGGGYLIIKTDDGRIIDCLADSTCGLFMAMKMLNTPD